MINKLLQNHQRKKSKQSKQKRVSKKSPNINKILNQLPIKQLRDLLINGYINNLYNYKHLRLYPLSLILIIKDYLKEYQIFLRFDLYNH